MKYKIRSLRNFKRRNFFDTYEPKQRIGINKENTVPLFFKIGYELLYLGGLLGLWVMSILMCIKGVFSFSKKVNNFSFNKKMIEFRIKKH